MASIVKAKVIGIEGEELGYEMGLVGETSFEDVAMSLSCLWKRSRG